jgi:hypothetical protein
MLLMIENRHRNPVASANTRYPTASLVFVRIYHPVTIGIVHCHPKK